MGVEAVVEGFVALEEWPDLPDLDLLREDLAACLRGG